MIYYYCVCMKVLFIICNRTNGVVCCCWIRFVDVSEEKRREEKRREDINRSNGKVPRLQGVL